MAPYTIAHLKISLKLVETGYKFCERQGLQVYLTNTLEPGNYKNPSGVTDNAFWHEVKMIQAVKTKKAFTVIV